MKRLAGRQLLFLLFLLLLAVLVILAALFCGSSFVPYGEFYDGNGALVPLVRARMSRILTSFVVGGSLALAGCAYQAVLRNPLAEPFILGVSGGSALGAALSFITGAAVSSIYAIPAFAALGGLCAVSFVLLLGMLNRGDSTSLLLSGVVAGTISSSCLMCLVTIAGTQEMCSMTWFLLGDLAATDPLLLRFFAVFAPFIAFLLWLLSPKANALALGDDYAWSMGSDPKKTSCALIFLASLLTAGSVALSGIIGFVGLIVPHILRKCGYSDNRKLFPLSFFAGGIFLIFCDLVSRSVFPEREVPSGVITSLLGGALFLWLLHGRNRERRGK